MEIENQDPEIATDSAEPRASDAATPAAATPAVPRVSHSLSPSGSDDTAKSGEDRSEKAATSQYEFVIDLDSDNTHASVIRMVGRSRRVLELGPASGYMSKVLRDRDCTVVGIELDPDMAAQAAKACERVIVGDLDALDLSAELSEDRFDVIVAADVLEHLKDPLTALQRLRPFLKPEGYFVVSLPNVAHASVRLALLQGRFEYGDLGLLDRTHLRFFTHETIRQLFDDAELAVVEVHRQEAPIAVADVPVDLGTVPEELIRELEADPDARTYQFVVKAVPLELPGLRELQRHVHEQALAQDRAEREVARLRDQVAPQIQELEQALAAIAGREGEIRSALIEAHDQVLRRDEEIERLKEKNERVSEEAAELQRSRGRLAELERQLGEQREHDDAEIAARDEHIHRLRTRIERIASSPPARVYAAIGRLPLMRRIVARRTAGYERMLGSGESPDG